MSHTLTSLDPTVAKSFDNAAANPIIGYCCGLTVIQHPLQKELQESTLKYAEWSIMLGAPEVLTIGSHFIKFIGAKKVLDVGTYTGASALAWALAIPEDGKVATMDVELDNFKRFGLPVIEKDPKTRAKIETVEGPAIQHLGKPEHFPSKCLLLDKLIASGEKGTFDFAFIDADKESYPDYYNRCVELLRPGGVIFCDNALFFGRVLKYDPKNPEDSEPMGIDKCNKTVISLQKAKIRTFSDLRR